MVLPGRAYPVTQPVISGVVDVLVAGDYDVCAVEWTLTELPDDPTGFVVEHLASAAADGCDLVVGKSLGTRASGVAANRSWPAVWLTPLLTDVECVAGIRANPAPQLVVGGTADPFFDVDVARSLDCRVLELPDVDHALSASGDGVVPPAILARVAAATREFLEEIT